MKKLACISLLTFLVLGTTLLPPSSRVSAGSVACFAQAGQDTGRVVDMTQQRQLNRLYGTGFKYYEIQEFANAIPALKRYTELDSTNIDVWYLLATCYVQTRTWDEAVNAFKAILRHSPEETNALQNLAYIYNEQGLDELHLSTYERIVELNPTNSEFVEYLLALYRNKRDEEGMLRLLQGMAERSPDDAGFQRQMADIYGRQGDVTAQAQALEKAIEKDP